MYSKSLIELALLKEKCTQKALAAKLQVSPTQISKWKSGESMSDEMKERLTVLTDIGARNPDLVCRTGGIEQADEWQSLILYLADRAADYAETGYKTAILVDDNELLPTLTLGILIEMGVKIPSEFPVEMAIPSGEDDLDYKEYDKKLEAFYDIPLIKKIDTAFHAANDIYGFWAAYIANIFFGVEDIDEGWIMTCELNDELLDLAFAKTGKQSELSPKFNGWRYNVNRRAMELIDSIKKLAINKNIPLKAELSHLIVSESGSLGMEAEAESFGLSSRRLHPDVYMNEIMENLRLVHKVLPLICDKLGITQEELHVALDDSDPTSEEINQWVEPLRS